MSNRKSRSPGPHIHFSIRGEQPFPFVLDAVRSSRITLRRTTHADTETIEIPPERWERFWRELEKIGVWRWKSEYVRQIAEGASWELDIAQTGRRLKTHGVNAYPECEDPVGEVNYPPGGQFDRFLQAISRLAGISVDQIGSEPSDYD